MGGFRQRVCRAVSSATMRLVGDNDIVWLTSGRKLAAPQQESDNKKQDEELRTSTVLTFDSWADDEKARNDPRWRHHRQYEVCFDLRRFCIPDHRAQAQPSPEPVLTQLLTFHEAVVASDTLMEGQIHRPDRVAASAVIKSSASPSITRKPSKHKHRRHLIWIICS